VIEKLLNSELLHTAFQIAKKNSLDIFLVGGAIRDLFLTGSISNDLDFILSHNAKAVADSFSRFYGGTFFCLDRERDTYRSLIHYNDDYYTIDFSTNVSNDIYADLTNRDFSINSIALKLQELFEGRTLNFIDPAGGLEDLHNRSVRASAPASLISDPVRILRAVRISLKYSLTIYSTTLNLIHESNNLLPECPWERIRSELFLILNLPDVMHSLKVLDSLGLLCLLLPEITIFKGMQQGTHHEYDLWEHSIRTVHFIEVILQNLNYYFPQHQESLITYFNEQLETDIRRTNLLKFIALIHDTGKPSSLITKGTQITFYRHDQIGKKINSGISKRFKLSSTSTRIIANTTQHHMRVFNLSHLNKITNRAKYRFFTDLNYASLDTLVLAIADMLSTRKYSDVSKGQIPVLNLISDLMDYYFTHYSKEELEPLINGNEIMEMLNLETGERIGEILCLIANAERNGSISTREEAIRLISSIDLTKLAKRETTRT